MTTADRRSPIRNQLEEHFQAVGMQEPVLEKRAPDAQGLAGRPASPMDYEPFGIEAAGDDLAGVATLQIRARCQRDFWQIVQAPDVLRPQSRLLEKPPVIGYAGVGMMRQGPQLPRLESADPRAAAFGEEPSQAGVPAFE